MMNGGETVVDFGASHVNLLGVGAAEFLGQLRANFYGFRHQIRHLRVKS